MPHCIESACVRSTMKSSQVGQKECRNHITVDSGRLLSIPVQTSHAHKQVSVFNISIEDCEYLENSNRRFAY